MSTHSLVTPRATVVLLLTLLSAGAAAVGPAEPRAIPLGSIVLPVPVWADCHALPEGAYDLQRAADGESEARGQYWVEFLQRGVVTGRELATVVTPEEADRINHGTPRPGANGARIDVIRATRYVRLWINHGRFDYLVNLPEAPPCGSAPLVAAP